MATLESTSDYWRTFYYLLEACGLPVQLVNAREVKNVPSRPKTDVHDCVWLAKLTERGMLLPSFVPPAAQRRLRDYTRARLSTRPGPTAGRGSCRSPSVGSSSRPRAR